MSTEDSSNVVLSKPVRPNIEEVQTQTGKLTEMIEKYAARIQEIKDIISQAKTNRNEIPTEQQELLKSIKETRESFQTILRQKQLIRDELNKANQKRQTLRSTVRELRTETKFTNEEEIDEKIQKLEAEINGAKELSPEEESHHVDEIRQLAKYKEVVKNLKSQIESMQYDDYLCDSLVKKLKEIDAELDECKGTERELNKELERMREQREEAEQEINALKAEKQECWDVMCALRAKKKEINETFSEKMNEFRRLDREYREQLKQEDRRKKDEARRAMEVENEEEFNQLLEEKRLEREAQEKKERERKQKKEKKKVERSGASNNVEPENGIRKVDFEKRKIERERRKLEEKQFLQQQKVDACDQLLAYLAQHRPAEKLEKVSNSNAKTSSLVKEQISPPEEGLKKVQQRKDVELDGWFAGTGKKSKSKKGKKPIKTENSEDKRLVHSLQILQLFNDLKIPVPHKPSEVPKSVDAVLEKKKHLQTVGVETESTSTPKKSSESLEEDQLNSQTVSIRSETEVEEVSTPTVESAVLKETPVGELSCLEDDSQRTGTLQQQEQEVLKSTETGFSKDLSFVGCDFLLDEFSQDIKINFKILGD